MGWGLSLSIVSYLFMALCLGITHNGVLGILGVEPEWAACQVNALSIILSTVPTIFPTQAVLWDFSWPSAQGSLLVVPERLHSARN